MAQLPKRRKGMGRRANSRASLPLESRQQSLGQVPVVSLDFFLHVLPGYCAFVLGPIDSNQSRASGAFSDNSLLRSGNFAYMTTPYQSWRLHPVLAARALRPKPNSSSPPSSIPLVILPGATYNTTKAHRRNRYQQRLSEAERVRA